MMFLNYFYYFLLSCAVFSQVVWSKGDLKILNEDSWTDMLHEEWMVEFYAPWCPACQQLEPVWKDFAEWSDDLNIKVGNIDVTTSPGLSGRFMITALPTIFHVKDGVFRQYRGPRDKDSFISFVEEKKWQNLDPIPSWKSPQSYQMATVSSFFKLSMFLRSMHNTLVEDYGIPHWGSYVIFGLLTIVVGALLGLLVVCIIDFFCPSRMGYQPVPRSDNSDALHGKKHESDGEYEGEDVIKEDVADDVDIRRRKDLKTPK